MYSWVWQNRNSIFNLKNVLLIDDDHGFNFLNSRLLKKLNIIDTIHVCASGVSGLSRLEEMYETRGEIPDLVLLDIRMPGMDGFAFLHALQSLPCEIKDRVKVAMLTSSVNDDDFARSFEFPQVVDYIEKPLDPGKFFRTLKKAEGTI